MVFITKRKTNQQFIDELRKINPMVKPLEDYKGALTHLKTKCLKEECGHVWLAIPSKLLTGRGCPECSGRKITHKTFIKKVYDVNKNIRINGKYNGAFSRVECECMLCNHQWNPIANSLIQGFGCPKCNIERQRKTHGDFVLELNMINDSIKVIGDYVNNVTPIKVSCTKSKCNHEWMAYPCNLLRGGGCPRCKKPSSREVQVFNTLSEFYNIEPQKTFDGLVGINNGNLSYDFYINHEGRKILIEVQGRQHRMPVPVFGGEEKFKIQQEHDRRKRDYAEKNGYELIEIWDYDDCLEVLKEHNFIK